MPIADSNGIPFRNKVVAKFMPKINSSNAQKSNNGEKIDKLASINILLPPIPAKLSKAVNKITKYFKKNNQEKEKTKSYAQATTSSINNTREVLKSKKLFLIYRQIKSKISKELSKKTVNQSLNST